MSFLKTFCAASSKAGILNIAGLGHATINFLGCSACASLSPKEHANSLLVADLHEEGDLIAFVLLTGRSEMPYLIEIEKRDGIPYIDLEKPESKETWVPKPDRMIQLFKNGFMRVKIDNEWFSTDQSDRAKDHRILPVSAGNLMVRYAYGLAEAKEIINLAEEIQLQADAVELLEIEKEKNGNLHQQIREWENQVGELQRENSKYHTSVEMTHDCVNKMVEEIKKIRNEMKKFFPNKENIEQYLCNIASLRIEAHSHLAPASEKS